MKKLLEAAIVGCLIAAVFLTASLGDVADGANLYPGAQRAGVEGLVAVGLIFIAIGLAFIVRRINLKAANIATTEIPSPHPRVVAVRLGGDDGVVLTPAFGFKLDPDLDRSSRQPKVPELLALDGFINREKHPKFFGSLSRDRHLSVVS